MRVDVLVMLLLEARHSVRKEKGVCTEVVVKVDDEDLMLYPAVICADGGLVRDWADCFKESRDRMKLMGQLNDRRFALNWDNGETRGKKTSR